MPYRIHKSIDIDFAHHVSGHEGACINIHGHTWKFEVGLSASVLDDNGFVVDFKLLKQRVLEPVHVLLDHALALGENMYEAIRPQLLTIGTALVSTRNSNAGGLGYKHIDERESLLGARNVICSGTKIAVLPFTPTSERLAEWLFNLTALAFHEAQYDRVSVDFARIYETLHPVESVAQFDARDK